MTLREKLIDWTDIDVAEYDLAVALGLMSSSTAFATDAKHVFWSSNPIGKMLHEMLMMLVEQGVVQQSEEDDHASRLRWMPDFQGSWENQHA